MRRVDKLVVAGLFVAGLLLLTYLSGCADGTGVHPPVPETPDAEVLGPPPPDAFPADTRLAAPDTRLASDSRPSDAYVKPTPDALPRTPDTLSPDARPASPDVLPPTPDAGYVNKYGWTPYLADGSEAPCCVTCGDYDGCLVLIHTTPFCSITVGSSCFQGGTGTKSVWPTCQKPPAGGCRPWSP